MSAGQMSTFWGQSTESFDAAVAAAAEAARAELPDKKLDWFEVIEFRGAFTADGLQYQTAIRVGYS